MEASTPRGYPQTKSWRTKPMPHWNNQGDDLGIPQEAQKPPCLHHRSQAETLQQRSRLHRRGQSGGQNGCEIIRMEIFEPNWWASWEFLVGVFNLPFWKYESLSDDDIPIYEMESHKSHVPNHQPAIIPLKLPFAGDLPIKNGDFPIDTNKNHHTFSIAAATIYHVSRGINFRISGANLNVPYFLAIWIVGIFP